MKKLILFAIVLMIAGGAGGAAVSAHAATSLPASQVLGADNASALRQTLDAFQALLDVIRIRIADTGNPLSDGQKSAMYDTLGGMRASLLGISATVASLEQKALAASYGAPYGTTGGGEVAVAPGAGANVPAGDGALLGSQGEYPAFDETTLGDEVAAVGSFADKKGLLWGGFILLVLIAAGMIFLRARSRRKAEKPDAPSQEAKLPFTEGSTSDIPRVEPEATFVTYE